MREVLFRDLLGLSFWVWYALGVLTSDKRLIERPCHRDLKIYLCKLLSDDCVECDSLTWFQLGHWPWRSRALFHHRTCPLIMIHIYIYLKLQIRPQFAKILYKVQYKAWYSILQSSIFRRGFFFCTWFDPKRSMAPITLSGVKLSESSHYNNAKE